MAFGMDPTIISTTPETQSSKKMSNSGNDLDKKPRKRQRIKRHRPKIRDESTPRKTPKSRIEPSTPKPKTPRRTIPTSSPHQKHVRKDSGKVDTSIYGDRQATDRSSGCAEKPCRRALRFNLENHLINQKDGEEAVTFTEEHNNYERKDDVKFLGFSLQNFDNRALFPNSDCATESCMNLVNEKSKIRARDSFGEMSRQAANPNPEQRESSCMDGNGKPKMVYSYQRRNKSLSTFSCKLDFNLNLEQQYFDSCSELEKIVHEYKSGEKRIHKSAYEGELNANSETENQNMCDVMKNEPGVDSNLQSCYRFGSLQVYQRIFKLNECLKNSRKLGPNCPSIYKKTRMQRRKATTFGGFWNATTVDQCQRKVNPSCRKEVSLSYGACRPINKTGKQRLFRRLTQKAMLERGKNIKRFSNTAISKSNFLVQLGQRGTKQKSEANKDPESFKWVLNSWKTWGCRRKRLFNRRQKLASSVVRLDMASQTKAVIVHPEFLGCALKSKRKRYNKFAEKIDLSSSGNHPFKSQSETTLSRAPTIGIQDFDDETFKYFVEVHNEDVHRRQRKSLYDVELSVGNLVSRHEDIQNSPMQCDDFVLGVQIYPPRQSLEIEMLKNQPAKDQSLETQNINEMGPFLHKTVSYCDNILECPLQCRNGLIEIPVCYQQREDIMLKSVQHQENVALDFEGKHQVPKDVSPIINEDAFTKAMVKLVIERLERLHISNECNQLVKRDKKTHSELIPYNGKLDPLKRRKPPPPKVDFDRETMIICNLLMENDGSEVREEVDKDNAKSRKEREMFCGRTDTFIARMHAIQGNRRFSRWGGSVVDSVVGVYLTQNVSDNCSSSAFMSLAASFPPVSKDTDCKENIVCGHKSVNIEEPQIPENKEQSYVYPTEQDMGYQFVENGESHIFSTGKAVPGSMEDEVIVKDAVQGFPDASRDENLTNISASCSTDKSTTYREFLLLEEINFLQQFCGPQDRKISCQESFGELQSMKDAFSSDTSGLNGTCALHSSASLPHFDDNLDSVHHVGDEVIVKDAVQGFPDASRDENLTNISASCSTDKSTTYRESLLLEEINFLQQFCGHQDGKISCQESFGELQSMKDAFSSNTSGLNGTRALHSSASLPHFDDNLDSVHHVGDEVIVKDAVQGFPDASRDENLTNISASCSTDKSTTYRELLLLEEINFLQQFCGPQDGKISCQESFGELQSMKDAFSSDTSGLNGTRALHSYASLPHFDDNLDSVHHVGDEVIVKDAVQGFPDASRDENLTNISASCSTDKSTTYRELLLLEEINFLQQFCGPQDGKISCQESFGELQSMKDAFSSDTSGLNGTRALHSNASLPHFDDNLDSVHHVGVSGYGRMEESSDISNLDQRNYFKSETVIREKDTQRIQEPLIDQMSSSSKFHEAVMTKKNSFCGSKSPAVVNPNDYQGINNANNYHDGNKTSSRSESTSGRKKGKVEPETQIDWDALRKTYSDSRSKNTTGSIDSANWEAVRKASVEEVAKVIAARGMNNILAGRIKDFLDRIVKDHGSIDLEWLRNVPPDKAKEYLLSIPGLGLKSVECLRLLTLHHVAFPVDTNVGRIVVRLGWVPLQPLPEDVQIHLLNQYPLVDAIQKYLWPRLCTLDQQTLYQLHYQMITFGKVFCTKKKPNCNACPMRGECRHFASAFASARLRLPGPQGKHIIISEAPVPADQDPVRHRSLKLLPVSDGDFLEVRYESRNCEPIVEVPASPEPISSETPVRDIEDFGYESEDEIPIIRLNAEKFQENLRNFMEKTSFSHQESDMSKALVPLSPEATSIPVPKLKDIHRLRTVHQVYELPDLHPLLVEFEKREPDDPSPYLLRTWTTDEMASSSQQSRKRGNTQDATPCDACFSGDMVQEQNDQTVKGTILIPCRTATRGTFPLNGTYFQVNEVFADHKSSRCPIAVPRESIWNLKKRSLYCGKSATSIFKGMSTEEIQFCFWKAFVCVRGVDRVTRDARPLSIKFHPSKNKHADDEE